MRQAQHVAASHRQQQQWRQEQAGARQRRVDTVRAHLRQQASAQQLAQAQQAQQLDAAYRSAQAHARARARASAQQASPQQAPPQQAPPQQAPPLATAAQGDRATADGRKRRERDMLRHLAQVRAQQQHAQHVQIRTPTAGVAPIAHPARVGGRTAAKNGHKARQGLRQQERQAQRIEEQQHAANTASLGYYVPT